MQETPLLISKEDLKKFRKISANLGDTQINPLIQDAQEYQIRPFLGDDLFIDLLDNFTDLKYQTLLAGESFTYPTGSTKKVRFTGLGSAICYFTLELIISEGNIHITATGSFEKDNEFSKPISAAERARIANNYRERALSVLADARKYLNIKKTAGDFPLWNDGSRNMPSPSSEPRFSIVHRMKKFQ